MRFILGLSLAFALLLAAGEAYADSYSDTISPFKNAGDSAAYFPTSYVYAVFPTVGEAGFVVGGAHGKGRVYLHDKLVGDATMSQLSAGTSGATSEASGGKNDANTKSLGYQKGLAVFTIAKGGLMYSVTVAGQKFTYVPRGGE